MFDKKEYNIAYYKANKEKHNNQTKAWREANKEKIKAYKKAWYEANKEKLLAQEKAWYKKNKEKVKAYKQANKGKINALTAKRKASKLNRTPSWLTKEDWNEIKDIYRMSKRRSEVEGILYHVDHIIPLQGKNISGLHVPNNLQILKARDNISKGNRHE